MLPQRLVVHAHHLIVGRDAALAACARTHQRLPCKGDGGVDKRRCLPGPKRVRLPPCFAGTRFH